MIKQLKKEFTYFNFLKSYIFQMYYDYTRKILRIDHNEDVEANKGIPMTDIHDFNTGQIRDFYLCVIGNQL